MLKYSYKYYTGMESLHWEGLTEWAMETAVSMPKGKSLHCRDRAKHGRAA